MSNNKEQENQGVSENPNGQIEKKSKLTPAEMKLLISRIQEAERIITSLKPAGKLTKDTLNLMFD